MKKIGTIILSTLLFVAFGTVSMATKSEEEQKEYSGRVLDKKNNAAISRCKVYIKGTEIGTITNSDGGFTIKVKKEDAQKNLVFSAVGYARYEVNPETLDKSENKIYLLPMSVVMDEIVIWDPIDLLMEALSRAEQNYSNSHETLTAFYRETIKKNKKYVDVSQGNLNIKKTPYGSNANDRAQILKGYRSKAYSAMDTLVFKLKGGVNTMLYLDAVKHPGLILRRDMIQYYDYEISDVKMIDDMLNYEISFAPKPNLNTPLYTGKIYIEGKSLGISEISFGYTGKDLVMATSTLVQKKPSLAKVTPLKVWYDVEYRKSGRTWYQYYTKSNLDMKVNWKKRLFNSTFYSNSEMVVTDRKIGAPIPPIGKDQTVRSHHFFAEKASQISDEEFWSAYNIIRPEDDLKKALTKIEKKAGN